MTPPGRSDAAVAAFAGPSCPPALRRDLATVQWRPPAAAGDMLALLDRPPRSVALIDGVFDQQPAVRHKELLLLLAAGVHVVGAASMGALRAAELSPFGMHGAGRIYRAYAEGRLQGDDEVALLHGPAEFDWAALTVPLVNVRATLLAARRARRLCADHARTMLRCAHSIFYKERTWEALSSAWLELGGRDRCPEPFVRRLPAAAVDVKQADARAGVLLALQLAGETPAARPAPPHTIFTDALARGLPAQRCASEQGAAHPVEELGA